MCQLDQVADFDPRDFFLRRNDLDLFIWVFPKIGVGPQNGWFIMEILMNIDDLGIPLFSETPIYIR